MCGILGIAAFGDRPGPERPVLERMSRTLVHRGPDDGGVDIAGGVGLGMRRLVVIDPQGGRQPMVGAGGAVRVVFNGEIYNFRELRRSLEHQGHAFATRSDTEVVLRAYETWGNGFAARLNGMFAVAVHDARSRKLLLVRDHMGIKPLYYRLDREDIVWGSEIKALLASGRVLPELDVDALGQFMAWEYVPGPATLLRGVRKLGPGEMLEVDLADGRARITTYWEIPLGSEDAGIPGDEWADQVDAKLAECVRRQLVADVPLGAFLSGGVDSSLLVAAMDRPSTFTIGFDDPSYNELPHAEKVARHLGVELTSEIIRPDAPALFGELLEMLDDPIGDFSIFPTFMVSRLARREVTVALSGDGGDELFGGYESYVAQGVAGAYGRLPGWLRNTLIEPPLRRLGPRPAKKGLVNKMQRFLEGFHHPAALAHARWRMFAGDAMRRALFDAGALEGMHTPPGRHIEALLDRAQAADEVNRMLYVDCRSYLPDNILTKVDRMSMSVSLETRVPFLDPELVALAFRIPGRFKVAGTRTKGLLRQVAARHVPAACAYRPKEGFSIPIKHWLCTTLRPVMEDLLSRSRVEGQGLLSWPTVDRLKREHLSGRSNHSHVLWSLIVFQAWQDRWLAAPRSTDGLERYGGVGR